MKKYIVRITEELSREVTVRAKSKDDADKIARQKYRDCQIVLTSDDFVGVDFEVEKND